MSLEGQVAVVTGSATGIGRACAVRLAQDGADIGLLDLNAEGLDETRAAVEAEGRRCEAIAVDLTDRAPLFAAFESLRASLGFLEILHNNAGGAFQSAPLMIDYSSAKAGRVGEPEDIAHAVSFLASPGASYVTGEHLLVAGGRTIH